MFDNMFDNVVGKGKVAKDQFDKNAQHTYEQTFNQDQADMSGSNCYDSFVISVVDVLATEFGTDSTKVIRDWLIESVLPVNPVYIFRKDLMTSIHKQIHSNEVLIDFIHRVHFNYFTKFDSNIEVKQVIRKLLMGIDINSCSILQKDGEPITNINNPDGAYTLSDIGYKAAYNTLLENRYLVVYLLLRNTLKDIVDILPQF